MSDDDEALFAAVREAVKLGLIPKEGTPSEYIVNVERIRLFRTSILVELAAARADAERAYATKRDAIESETRELRDALGTQNGHICDLLAELAAAWAEADRLRTMLADVADTLGCSARDHDREWAEEIRAALRVVE